VTNSNFDQQYSRRHLREGNGWCSRPLSQDAEGAANCSRVPAVDVVLKGAGWLAGVQWRLFEISLSVVVNRRPEPGGT